MAARKTPAERAQLYRLRKRQGFVNIKRGPPFQPISDSAASTVVPLAAERGPDGLYVIVNPLIPGMVKIGRAQHSATRTENLSRCQPFQVEVAHDYPTYGHLEHSIHTQNVHLRVEGGPGREWFWMEPEQADKLIHAAIADYEIDSMSDEALCAALQARI